MSKLIKICDEEIRELEKEFKDSLKKVKLFNGTITFSKKMKTLDSKAIISFTELAYLKMVTLVREFDDEVAWHGTVEKKKSEDGKSEYIVKDILVYPQEVTGATVTTDQERYEKWLYEDQDDEVFNSIRMQGHSHVNMGTTPSATDEELYSKILDQLDDSMFYIFLIWNKKNEKTVMIYDLEDNTLYENGDVSINILEDGTGIEKFLKDAVKAVERKTYTYKQDAVVSTKSSTGYGKHGKQQSLFGADKKKKDYSYDKTRARYGSYNYYDDYDDYGKFGYGYRDTY